MAISRKSKVKPFGTEIVKGPVGSVLSNMYRTILFGLGMGEDRYDALMSRYIRKAVANGSRKDRADARAGLSEELLKETMTWKTFLKGLKFLAATYVEVTLNLWLNDKTSVHKKVFNLMDFDVEADGDDDEAGVDTTAFTPGTILGSFFESIKTDLKISPEEHDVLMENYIKASHVSASKKSEAAAKSSLTKELSRPAMTWKSFVKGLNYLGAVKFSIRIKLVHAMGETTAHGIKPVVIGEINSN